MFLLTGSTSLKYSTHPGKRRLFLLGGVFFKIRTINCQDGRPRCNHRGSFAFQLQRSQVPSIFTNVNKTSKQLEGKHYENKEHSSALPICSITVLPEEWIIFSIPEGVQTCLLEDWNLVQFFMFSLQTMFELYKAIILKLLKLNVT